jgi:small-conductance mechanosensitive channel
MNETFPTLHEVLILAAVAVVYYLVLVGCAQWLRRFRNIQFGRFFHVFAVTAALMDGLALSGWTPPWWPGMQLDFGALTILFSTIPAITLINRGLWTRTLPDGKRADAPKLLADTTGLIVFISVGLIVWHVMYGHEVPTSLLAGSGVAAFVIGFAMQDLLGNILAGFALYISKPFKVGDLLQVDKYRAKVLEVTWRSTRLVTSDRVLLEVPNGTLVKQPIINYNNPDSDPAFRITINLHYNVPPARAQAVLRHAAETVPGVCAKPPPRVLLKQFADSSVLYEIKFHINNIKARSHIMSEVRSHCWYAVRRAGMEIPYPTITLNQPVPEDTAADARIAASAALRSHAIFSFLSVEQIDNLVKHSSVELFALAEPLVEQGAAGNSMFLIVQGSAEVRVKRDGVDTAVAKLGPGDCLGEISMLTGEKRSATVVALGEVEVVEITHHAFSAFVHQNPEVINRLGELLVKRQQENMQHAAKTTSGLPIVETKESVIRRLRSFFALGE